MRTRIVAVACVLSLPMSVEDVAAGDGEFVGVRVEHAAKRSSSWNAMTPGPVMELRQDDGSVIAELNGHGMVPTWLRDQDGRQVIACGDGETGIDFRHARPRAEEK